MSLSWESFISFLEEKTQSPIVISILRQTKLSKTTENEITIECKNLGAKIFLDSRKTEIEILLASYLEKSCSLTFIVLQKKKRREEITLPLPIIGDNNSIEKAINKAHLHDRYTFEHFAVSNSNHIAHAAAQAVGTSPGTHYNPLFIYGGVGVGKTHLMQAIGNQVLINDPTKKVLYATSEEFTNELIELIRKKNTSDFRDRFRKVEVLLIDDAQFIAGKNYVQEEFYHTFNTIIKNGGQIVLVSDRHPREISNLEDRLRSRFSGGLIIDMQTPDFELRSAILMIKAKERNISIDIEAAKKIAEKTSDARELEGKLLQIYSRLVITAKDPIITPELLGPDFDQQETYYRKRVDPQTVIKTVCSYYQIKPHDIKDQTRKSEIAFARQLIMYLLRAHFDFKLDEIAYILKRKDHTTIMHGVEKIRGALVKDRQLKETVDQILKIL